MTRRRRRCPRVLNGLHRRHDNSQIRGLVPKHDRLPTGRSATDHPRVAVPCQFLDTLAVILEAKGDVSGAQKPSIRAAGAPDDLYLLRKRSGSKRSATSQ